MAKKAAAGIAPDFTLGQEQARAAILASQHLTTPAASPVAAVEDSGFVRTLGGVDVYLAFKARLPGLRRAELDAEVDARRLLVSPAARGCIYLVTSADGPWALRLAASLTMARDERDRAKAGIRPGEVAEIATAVIAVLRERGALSTTALRAALPPGLVRSLGEVGKKVGISSPLPAALRELEFAGDVERMLEGGRLDSEKYLWRATPTNLFAEGAVPSEPAELHAALGRRFFRAATLATTRHFAEWLGVSLRDAGAAVERLGLVPLAVEGQAEAFWALPERRDLLLDPPAPTGVAFLPFEDNAFNLQGGPAFLCDPRFHGLPVRSWGMGGKTTTLGEAKHAQLRPVIAEGQLAGFWEYDPTVGAITQAIFAPVADATRRRLDEKADATAAFLRDEVGHGRSFSLDTDKDLVERAAYLRTLVP